MYTNEDIQADLEQIGQIQSKAVRDYSMYRSLVIRKEADACTFQIDEAKVRYRVMEMYDFHVMRGIANARLKFQMGGNTADYNKSQAFATASQNASLIVLKRVQGGTRAVCRDMQGQFIYDEIFNDSTLIRLMCLNAYQAARAELESKLQL